MVSSISFKLSLEVLQRVIDKMPYGVVVTDPSLPDNPIRFVNDGFTHLTGYPSEEIIGRNCRFLQGEDTKQAGLIGLRAAINNNDPYSTTLRNYRKNGSLFYNSLSIAPVSTCQGDFFVGFQTDVSDRESAHESYQKRSESLEQRLAGFAHDLVNRSTRKQLLIDLLTEDLSSLSDSQKELFSMLRSEIAGDSLFAESELGTLRSINQSYTVEKTELVDPALSVASSYELHNPSVPLRVHAQGPVFGFTNPGIYVRALENVVDNAVKYTPKGRIDIRVDYDDSYAVVSVEDTGVGIPAGSLEDVFVSENTVRYQQQVAEGHGVGLSYVRESLKQVGGLITASSSQGEGSVFTLRVPRAN